MYLDMINLQEESIDSVHNPTLQLDANMFSCCCSHGITRNALVVIQPILLLSIDTSFKIKYQNPTSLDDILANQKIDTSYQLHMPL